MVAHRQGRDKGGQRRADQAAFGQQQVPLAVSLEREHADAGTGRGLPAARAPHHLVAVLHAADPDAAVGALQLQDRERLRRADDRVPHLERQAAMGADHRPVALGTFRLQRRVRHVPLAPGCLPGLRPDGGGSFAPGGGAPSLGPPSLRPTSLPVASPPPPKGGSDEGGRELLVEFNAKRSLNSIAMV